LEACAWQGDPEHECRVEGHCGRFLELWNLVFIQYNRDSEGVLEPLPAKHVDTGMGFERIVSVLQGVDSNYKTDLFMPIIRRVQEMAGHTDAQVEDNIVAYRVIADHGRAVTFLVGDGVLPGNDGRNYVLRMILRRAARFGRKIGFRGPFLAEVAKVVIDQMGPQFPELVNRRQFILTTITQEEERFLRTLDLGLTRLAEELTALEDQGTNILAGDIAFRLYDTFGLPLEITRDVAEERGLDVDEAGYQSALEGQRQRARQAGALETPDEETLARYRRVLMELQEKGLVGEEGVGRDPYSTTELESEVVAILQDGESIKSAEEGDEIEVVLPLTSFYVESGGQVSDTGFISAYPPEGDEPVWEVEVKGVRQPVPGLLVHVGVIRRGQPKVGDAAWVVVDYERRMDIARNHTATHLLHSELRYVLGEHVQQAGSLVAPDRLRFDFNHPAMLTEDELTLVTQSVNDAILVNYPVTISQEEYQQAISDGVIALFGEKYGDEVRVLRIGWPGEPFSQELCGGTHVHETGEIGLFHIVNEEGVGAGVRRIEAVTGRVAVDLVEKQVGVLKRSAAYLGVAPDEVDRKVLGLMDELQSARRETARLQERLARREFESLLDTVQSVGGASLLSARVSAPSLEVLREMTDWFRDRLGSGVVALGTVLGDRPALVVAVTQDLVDRGVDASKLIRGMAQLVGGGGGGKPTLAQAGGRDPARLDDALSQAPRMLEEMLQ
jgi:alanyl-tRNA synthetase